MLGFPIRISTGRSSFAAHRSFSQLTTSFFGSWCQGIRPVLLLALSLRTQYHSRQGNCRVHLLFLFSWYWSFHTYFSMHELLKSIEIVIGNISALRFYASLPTILSIFLMSFSPRITRKHHLLCLLVSIYMQLSRCSGGPKWTRTTDLTLIRRAL